MYWHGSPRTFSRNKAEMVRKAISIFRVEVKIINHEIFLAASQDYAPLHEGFQYLALSHQSDYFRIYAMHHFGGGYADIKHYHYDIRPYFKMLYDNPDKDAMGYPEKIV